MHSFAMDFLPAASVAADNFMMFWNVALAVGIVMFVGTLGVVFYFSWKYRRRDLNSKEEGQYLPGNYLIEFSGIFMISIWVAVFFLWGWKDYSYIINPRMDEYEVNVIGQQWQWTAQYANGKTLTNEFFIPKGRPVRFVITSKDVLHSFFIPEFRVKQDAVPGQFTTLHATPTLAGDFHVFCAQYCGTAHSKMLATVHVLEPEDFQKWLDGVYTGPAASAQAEIPALPGGTKVMSMAERGAHLFRTKACVSCHTVDGSQKTAGPSVKGLFGASVAVEGGAQVVADENYIRESIMDPIKKVVKGYAPQMPTFRGMLSDEDVNDLIAYIKTVK
ncbi:MAG: cytochrome c oxidase subunit II [Bdellovibrionota bacterium]